MKIKRILCPTDFSEYSAAANQYASVLAEAHDAEIVYLHVPMPDVPYGSFAYVDMKLEDERARKKMEEVKPTIEGISFSYAIEFGAPSTVIVEYANSHDIDLVVLGTHGRTGLRRALMGSVAESIIRHADCPVVAVKANASVPQPG